MSYLAYINGNLLELSDNKPIAQTKQVNDLARLDNRQSNFTNKFTAPFTASNIKAMQFVYFAGNQSNMPYQKNEFDLIDADTGRHLIYKGWANIIQTSNKGYEINVYDGLIDFYRRIENKTLTNCDVSGLDHAKSISNIVSSWTSNQPYIYAIADYNGKNEYVAQNGQIVNINTDFQVPSARISYIWERIFAFAGFTYSGSYFQTQDFLNLFMSFPNPIKGIDVIINSVTDQQPTRSQNLTYFSNGSLENIYEYANPLPIAIASTYITGIGTTSQIPAIGVNVWKSILETKTYRININCGWQREVFVSSTLTYETTNYYYFQMKDNLGVTVLETIFEKDQNFYFDGIAGYTFRIEVTTNATLPLVLFNAIWIWGVGGPTNLRPIYTGVTPKITIDEYSGERVLFSEALNEFSCTDFVKEIVTRAGITAFKDKYHNHIEYLTMSEILQSEDITDWSDKFQYKDNEGYKIGQYAKRNWFKYRHNSQEEKQNNGFIDISDENLSEETTIFDSKIYSPERDESIISGFTTKVFKIWEKEIKENAVIEYKELTGKFYFLKFALDNTVTAIIGSETLNLHQAINSIGKAVYNGVSFQSVIDANYPAIESILDKAKLIDMFFYLKPTDVERYSFKGLIYVEQLACYYLVNKILNYTKGKITKCEVFEVDYKKVIPIVGPVPNSATYITIDSFSVVGCVVTVTYSTDATLNSNINVVCAVNSFGLPVFTPPDPMYGYGGVVQNTAVQNTFSFTLQAGTFYVLRLNIQDTAVGTIYSNEVAFENTAGCLIVSPSTLVINSVTLLSSDAITQTFEIAFTTDAVLPRNVSVQNYKTPVPSGTFGLSFGGWSGYSDNGTANTTTITHSISRILGDPLQIQIKIGTKESNIFTI